MDYEMQAMLAALKAGTLDEDGQRLLIEDLWDAGELAKAVKLARSLEEKR